ncbi:MAG: thiamine pyrophosphate-binding protein [Dehalococcoidales bacterium]|nr:thiamine pyrophosphate-binding protein [Dehalococcoidales bacterium]
MKSLESNNVKYIFGIPGGHLLKFYDALYDSREISPILTKHESGASFMAVGYAQVNGGFGVCTGTVGPGATNLITGIASAYMDSIPVLVITAQVGSSAVGKGALQEATGEGRTVDHLEMFSAISKYSTRVYSGQKLHEALRNALRVSLNGRPGPSQLDIMSEVFATNIEIEKDWLKERIERYSSAGPEVTITKAADLILAAKNPAILAGAGAMDSSVELIELAEKYGIPVATTLRAKGLIPEDHDLCLGCLGLYGTNAANKYLRSGIDVLVAVGTSFSEFTSHAWDKRFQPSTALIQIDIDIWEISKNYTTTVGIMGEAKVVLGQLIAELKHKSGPGALVDKQKIIEFKRQREYFADPKMTTASYPIKPQYFLKSLRDILPRDAIVFGDIGNTLPWLEGFFPSLGPKTFFICSSLASMGYGVSASIGGQLAAPGKKVLCICGDGDFQMQGMEVITAVNYKIPVKWFILNNQKLAMIGDLQNVMFKGRTIASEFINPDFVKLAESMGAAGLRISRPEDIQPVVQQALENDRPTVVDVIIDPDEMPSYDARAEAMARAWGTSAPLLAKLRMIPEILKRR